MRLLIFSLRYKEWLILRRVDPACSARTTGSGAMVIANDKHLEKEKKLHASHQ